MQLISLRTYLKHQSGSYSCVKPSAETTAKLAQYVQENLSDFSTEQTEFLQSSDYHCTIVYSRTPVPIIEVLDPDLPITATPKQFSLFGENNDILVLEIESEELTQLFNQSSDLGATSDWTYYRPHLTIAKHVSDIDLDTLSPIDFDLVFDKYVVEALDEDA